MLVPTTHFTHGWGDPWLFAATSLNGWDLDLSTPHHKPPAPKPEFSDKDIRETVLKSFSYLKEAKKQAEKNKQHHRAELFQRDIDFIKKHHPGLFQ
jgi:hypothetical protein